MCDMLVCLPCSCVPVCPLKGSRWQGRDPWWWEGVRRPALCRVACRGAWD